MRKLGQLVRYMPITTALATVAAAAMAGVPLLNGFLSKEMFFAESLRAEGPVQALDRALPYIATLWGIFSVAYSLRFIHGVFFGPAPQGLPRTPQEPPRWMRFPIELLVLACLAVGVLPALTIGPFLDLGVRGMLGAQAPAYSLAAWHGVTTPLVMSFAALAGGAVLYAALQKYLARGEERAPLLPPIDARRAFDRALVTLTRRLPRSLERRLDRRGR
jgi:multicomponent K+:H+ antiporter subunit A